MLFMVTPRSFLWEGKSWWTDSVCPSNPHIDLSGFNSLFCWTCEIGCVFRDLHHIAGRAVCWYTDQVSWRIGPGSSCGFLCGCNGRSPRHSYSTDHPAESKVTHTVLDLFFMFAFHNFDLPAQTDAVSEADNPHCQSP